MNRNPTCIEFCDDVLGVKLTTGQAAFVGVAVDRQLPRDVPGKMRDAAIEAFGDLDEVDDVARKTVVLCAGRNSGKDELASCISLYAMMYASCDGIGIGDLPTAAVVSPTVRTSRILHSRALARVKSRPQLAKRLVGSTRSTFILRRPDAREAAFEVFAASRGGHALRGVSFLTLVMNEAAMFRSAADASINDHDVYNAASPRVRLFSLFLSTPWMADVGLFAKLAKENYAQPHGALVAVASTLEMRDNDPAIAAAVALEKERDEENAAREFVLNGIDSFMSTGGSLFFDPKSIDDAIDDSLGDGTPAEDNERVGCGGDIGLVRDASALVVVGARGTGSKAFYRVLTTWELRPKKGEPLRLSKVVGDFGFVVKSFNARGFVADAHNRPAAQEYAEKDHLSIWPRREGPNAQYESFVELRRLFAERRVRIPRDPKLLAQLRSIAIKPVSGGGWRVIVPRRAETAHGDLVAALVCAIQASVYVRLPGDAPMYTSVLGVGTRYIGDDEERDPFAGVPDHVSEVESTDALGRRQTHRRGDGGRGFGGYA